VTTYSATTALPCEHLERATAGLRTELRSRLFRAVTPESPDWDSLVVRGPVRTVDGRGRVWFTYTATMTSREPSRALQRLRAAR
jgi:hypothetical protein